MDEEAAQSVMVGLTVIVFILSLMISSSVHKRLVIVQCPCAYLTIPASRGSHSVRSGIRVIAINDSSRGISHGRIAIVVRSIDSLAILDSTNSTMPRGG